MFNKKFIIKNLFEYLYNLYVLIYLTPIHLKININVYAIQISVYCCLFNIFRHIYTILLLKTFDKKQSFVVSRFFFDGANFLRKYLL